MSAPAAVGPRPLLLGLSLLAVAAGGCGGRGELERRVAELEARIEEEVELSDEVAERRQVHEVAAATGLLDMLDLQGLTTRLAAGDAPRPADALSVGGAARALKHADWPPQLMVEAENAAEALDALGEALLGEDVERAAMLAPQALAFQLEMRRAAERWLDEVARWTRETRPPHAHGPHEHGPPDDGER